MTPIDQVEDLYEDYYEDCPYCLECGGRGWVIRCIDDLCHGGDECIHGDPPVRCSLCNRDGSREDGWL